MTWDTILTPAEIDAHFARIAELDPAFARESRSWYDTRGNDQLRASARQAWYSNERDIYVLARSFLAARGAALDAPAAPASPSFFGG